MKVYNLKISLLNLDKILLAYSLLALHEAQSLLADAMVSARVMAVLLKPVD